MASREWMITKVVGLLLGLSLLVSTGVGAANLFATLRRDVDRNEERIVTHEKTDTEKWLAMEAKVDEVEDDVHQLEIDRAKAEAQHQEVMRMLEDIKAEILKWEVANG